MGEYRIKFALVLITVLLWQAGVVSADTWRLQQDKQWKPVSAEGKDKFLLTVSRIKELVNTGQTEAVRPAFDQLKKDFPEITGPDLDAFIEAEILLCQGELTKAVRAYDKLLDEFPDSRFAEAALSRQFEIATAFLTGRKKTVLRFFKMSRYDEGVKLMERITTRTGMDAQMGLKAALALTKSYEKRKKFNEAYLKWWEISQQWESGPVGKDAVRAMAQCKHAVYNKQDEDKRHLFDDSTLVTAKSYYQKLKLLYPEEAKKIRVDETLEDIDKQLAYKQLGVARYYQRTDKIQAANFYYDMVINDWPDTKAAKLAEQQKQSLLEKLSGKQEKK